MQLSEEAMASFVIDPWFLLILHLLGLNCLKVGKVRHASII
jgi:hypothetical protein